MVRFFIACLFLVGCAGAQPNYKVVYPDPIPALQLEIITAVSVHRTDDYKFCASHKSYRMFSREKLHPLISKCRSYWMTYLPDERKCTDFAMVMDAWISECGHGNYAFGQAYGLHPQIGNHAFCIALLDTGELVGIDAVDYHRIINLDEWQIYKVEF